MQKAGWGCVACLFIDSGTCPQSLNLSLPLFAGYKMGDAGSTHPLTLRGDERLITLCLKVLQAPWSGPEMGRVSLCTLSGSSLLSEAPMLEERWEKGSRKEKRMRKKMDW